MREVVLGATVVTALAAGHRQPLSSQGTGSYDGRGVSANRSSPDPSVDLTAITIDYIEAVGRKDLDRVAALLDPGVEFTTPGGRDLHDAQSYLEAIAKLAPILVRNDVKTARHVWSTTSSPTRRRERSQASSGWRSKTGRSHPSALSFTASRGRSCWRSSRGGRLDPLGQRRRRKVADTFAAVTSVAVLVEASRSATPSESRRELVEESRHCLPANA